MTIYRASDGLPSNLVNNAIEDGQGYLWLTTLAGLVRFDGARFVTFNSRNTPAFGRSPGNRIWPLFRDRAGRLWISTAEGVVRQQARRFARVPSGQDSSFVQDQVFCIRQDHAGTVWLVTAAGRLFRSAGDSAIREVAGSGLPRASVTGLAVDREDDLWIGVSRAGVFQLRDGRVARAWHARDGLLEEDATDVTAGPDGAIWVGSASGATRIQGEHVTRFPFWHDRRTSGVSCLAVAADSTVWAATDGSGLWRYDPGEDDGFRPFRAGSGLASDNALCVGLDSAGDIWVSTREGLTRLRPVAVTVITPAQGLPAAGLNVVAREPGGMLWLGTVDGGVYRGRLKGSRLEAERMLPPGAVGRVMAITDAGHGAAWLGGYRSGLTLLGPGIERRWTTAEGLPGNEVLGIVPDGERGVWLATDAGVVHFHDGRFTRTGLPPGLADSAANCLQRDARGTVWVETPRGLFRIRPGPDGAGVQSFRLSVAQGGPGFQNGSLGGDGTLWALSDLGGLMHVFPQGDAVRFEPVGREGGPNVGTIRAYAEDGEGNLWLQGELGLARVRRGAVARAAGPRGDGLAGLVADDGLPDLPRGIQGCQAVFRDHQGRVWFTFLHAIVIADPRRLPPPAPPPRPVLAEVVLDGTPVTPTDHLTVGPDTRRVEFRYTGVSLRDGRRLQFQYRLDGFDTTWVDARTSREVAYTRLAPGPYRFRMQTRGPDGSFGPAEASLGLEVLPPFYRTWWFLGGLAVLAALGVWGLQHLRVRALHARYAAVLGERVRVARELHDTLLQGFSGIALQLGAAADAMRLGPEQRRPLDRILTLVDRTLTEAREAVWDLRSPGLVGEGLAGTIRDTAAGLFEDVPTVVDVRVTGEPLPLAAGEEVQCLRVAREALGNARRHAGARRVEVTLHYARDRFVLTVADDGQGFDFASDGPPAGHWGLTGMRERARSLGASLVIESRPGLGTTVRLELPRRERRAREQDQPNG